MKRCEACGKETPERFERSGTSSAGDYFLLCCRECARADEDEEPHVSESANKSGLDKS
jgi:hypothetical protein